MYMLYHMHCHFKHHCRLQLSTAGRTRSLWHLVRTGQWQLLRLQLTQKLGAFAAMLAAAVADSCICNLYNARCRRGCFWLHLPVVW